MLKLTKKKFRWSRNLAYAIGLLVTDGNLSKDGRHINLRSSDQEQLQTFKECLKIANPIRQTNNNGFTKKPSYRVQFGDVLFYKWLVSIGIEPAKTYTIGEIKIPKSVFRDFLRGHLDGDGCIQTYIDKYNTYKGKTYQNRRIYTRFISASEKHIRWLYQSIRSSIDVKGALIFIKPRLKNRVNMWEIRFSKYDSLKLFEWMYYNSNVPCLQRKRKIADDLLKELSV